MKRLFDIVVSLLLMLLLIPIILLTVITVFIKLGSPVLFCQKRPGLKGKIFSMYKFRSMTGNRNAQGQLLSDANRTTAVGHLMRSLSIDELPSLLNVLKGDMSLVGPRPLLVEYLPLYSDQQAKRHDVKPGITGWAQVNGRNAVSWNDRFKLDLWYVENNSFLLDIKIFLMTIKKVFIREGISADGEATMPKFNGNSAK